MSDENELVVPIPPPEPGAKLMTEEQMDAALGFTEENTTAEFKEPGAADPPPLAALADDLASLPAHVEPGPVRPSEEAEEVFKVLRASVGQTWQRIDRPEEDWDDFCRVFAEALVRRFPGLTRTPAAEERRLVIADLRSRAKELRDVFHNEGDAEKLEALAGTYEYALNDKRPAVLQAPEEPLAFAGGSNILLEFNGDSWTALCNAAAGTGYVRQTKCESETFKTPQQALAAVLRIVRERAKGVQS